MATLLLVVLAMASVGTCVQWQPQELSLVNSSSPPPPLTSTMDPEEDVNVTLAATLRPLTPSQLTSPPPALDLSPPQLPPNYHVTLKVWDAVQSTYFTVLEHGEGNSLAVTLVPPTLHHPPTSCLVHLTTSTGHVIRGIQCHRSSALPQSCFCGNGGCASFVPAATLLAFLLADTSRVQAQEVGVDGAELWSWKVTRDGVSVRATFARAEGHSLVPAAFAVEGSARTLGLLGGNLRLVYSVANFRKAEGAAGGWDRPGSPFLPPRGVFCPPLGPQRKRLPRLAEQFSVIMETVAARQRTLSYEEFHFDFGEKLAAFRWRPHLHALPATLFAAFPFAQTLPADTLRVVHDFKTGLQFEVNEATGNCTLGGIPAVALDAWALDSHHVRLRHAQELLSADPDSFVYAGMREVRGVLADVWVSERNQDAGEGKATLELFFSHDNWSVEVEGVNRVQRAPLGLATYSSPPGEDDSFSQVAVTHFLHYRAGHPAWHHFDIQPCLPRAQRLFLRLTLRESYERLVQFGLEAAQDSLRRAIAGLAGVSPLRVTGVFLQGADDDMGYEVDGEDKEGSSLAWFVLLERPPLGSSTVESPTPQLPLADAFQLMRSVVGHHSVSVRLELGPGRLLMVPLVRGSLVTLSEALHPGGRLGRRSLRLGRAAYTSGAVAGLALAMAVLGVGVGLMAGFLLWRKGRPERVPYRLAH